MQIGDAVIGNVLSNHLGLQHMAGIGTDRKERAIGGLTFRAQCGQHDLHDIIIMCQHIAQRIVKFTRRIAVGRTDKFIVETKGIKKRLQSLIIMRTKG